VQSTWIPELDAEHTGHCWAPIDDPPEPLHPGCRIVLKRFDLDELGIARAMVDGELASPQYYENLALFDVRITGTGTAYRRKLDEFVFRRPENYLSDYFLARCNGLSVIVHHPPSNTLNTEEFSNRVIGSIFIPYIGDGVRHPKDEVWGIAKVMDMNAAKWMEDNQLSTSPAVVFRETSVNAKLDLKDLGIPEESTILIEGKPSLLDHLAICSVGVWDKGEQPTGVVSENNGALAMAPT
jgi:hypothetical protein